MPHIPGPEDDAARVVGNGTHGISAVPVGMPFKLDLAGNPQAPASGAAITCSWIDSTIGLPSSFSSC